MSNIYKSLTPRQIMNLETPGFYKLPFFQDDADVEVVYATPTTARMKTIIIKVADGLYLDFYYNEADECFKNLTLPECDLEEWVSDGSSEESYHKAFTFGESWKRDNVGVPCPAEFADYEVVIGAYDDINEDLMVALDPWDML